MYQKLIVEGRLGGDAVVKTSKNGKKYLSFTLANTSGGKDNEKTTWYDVVSFEDRHTGKFAEYLKKGSSVVVDGKPDFSLYVDKSQTTRINYKIIVGDIEFTSSGAKRSEDGSSEYSRKGVEPPTEAPADMDMSDGPSMDGDDLPF